MGDGLTAAGEIRTEAVAILARGCERQCRGFRIVSMQRKTFHEVEMKAVAKYSGGHWFDGIVDGGDVSRLHVDAANAPQRIRDKQIGAVSTAVFHMFSSALFRIEGSGGVR